MKVSRRMLEAKGKMVVAAGALLMAAGCNGIDEGEASGIARAASVRAQAGSAASDATASAQAIKSVLPSAQAYRRGDRIARLYGPAMAEGATTDAAAEAFRAKAAGVLGAVAGDLQPAGASGVRAAGAQEAQPIDLMVDKATGKAKFKLYRYAQVRGGIPVYGAGLATLVKNSGNNPVVSATSTVRDLKDFDPGAVAARAAHAPVDPAKSMAALRAIRGSTGQAMPLPQSFARYSEPELVIYAGVGDEVLAPRLAMTYVGENDNPPAQWLFIADAATGDILYNASMVAAANIPGNVKGNETSGHVASECAPEVPTPLPYARVNSSTASTLTSRTGYFYLDNPGTTPVSVTSQMNGNYINLINDAGANEDLSMTVTPPNAANFMHNQANTQELVRAQTNAYIEANRARDFVVGYLPTYPVIGTQLDFPVHANGNDGINCPGNAWYFFAGYILLCQQSASVTNTAFGSAVYHEYGHHVVHKVNPAGNYGPYGEGMADTISVLITEEARIARGWTRNDCSSFLRSADNTCQYDATNCTTNCPDYDSPESHACGRLMSGIVWDIRSRLMASHPSDYRDIINALVLSSVPMHSGWVIDGSIAVDMLNLDDDDGNLDNGTPHRAEICGGFAEHGITCPGTALNPCASHCPSPTVFSWSGSYQSGPLGTGTVCRETTQAVAGGNCGNMAAGRQLMVNGTPMTCNNLNWASLPAAENGGYCITTTAGDYPWAFFTLW